jgi:hypothetical protein
MRRLLLILLIGVAIVAIDARLRARVQPHIEPVMQPLHERAARTRVREIQELIQVRASSGQRIPPAGDLTPFLVRVTPRDSAGALDPWGEPYRWEVAGGIGHVVSKGRDRIPDTEHDIRSGPVQLPRR